MRFEKHTNLAMLVALLLGIATMPSVEERAANACNEYILLFPAIDGDLGREERAVDDGHGISHSPRRAMAATAYPLENDPDAFVVLMEAVRGASREPGFDSAPMPSANVNQENFSRELGDVGLLLRVDCRAPMGAASTGLMAPTRVQNHGDSR
ncbi:hypothetical protein [Pendulispora albinea]|uniref:Uncharacterized protein n=1 Tax=Pendulispora albinea TaxID=2741071 RepID=A0ABZ2LQH0_9BACT